MANISIDITGTCRGRLACPAKRDVCPNDNVDRAHVSIKGEHMGSPLHFYIPIFDMILISHIVRDHGNGVYYELPKGIAIYLNNNCPRENIFHIWLNSSIVPHPV